MSRMSSALLMFAAVMLADGSPAAQTDVDDAKKYATCASYFFMAAKVRPLGEFDGLYRSGEFGLNRAIKLSGKEAAMTAFNEAASEINQIIDHSVSNFPAADDRFEVRCADIFREATRPD